jgi:hypothetical protein
VASQCRFHNKRKKAGQSVSVAQRTAVDDPMEFLADVIRTRPHRIASNITGISLRTPVNRGTPVSRRMTISPRNVYPASPTAMVEPARGLNRLAHAILPSSVQCSNR